MKRRMMLAVFTAMLMLACAVQAELVVEYEFDGATGGIAADSSGYSSPAVDGYLKVAAAKVFDAERQSQVLSLRNWNDYVACGSFNAMAGTNELTIAMWIKWNGFAASPVDCGLITKRTAFATNMMWMWNINAASQLCFKNNAGIEAISTQTVPTNTWVHVAVTLDKNHAVKFYINGQLDDPGVSGFYPADGYYAEMNIGTIQNGQNCLNGFMDDIKIFNEALDADGIAEVVGKASSPVPGDGWGVNPADGVELSWAAGLGATGHDVYFGYNWDDVNDADNTLTAGPGSVFRVSAQAASDCNYTVAETLDFGQNYYWRVDEITAAGIVRGDVWSFSTNTYFRFEDMESYDDAENPIYNTWIDGYAAEDNGAYVELDTINGDKVMKFSYDNDGSVTSNGYTYSAANYSEAYANVADLYYGTDWTAQDFKILTLYFSGNADNDASETMYVVLKDASGNSAEVRYGDGEDENITDLTDGNWYHWDIELSRFSDQGVDLSNVSKIYIGFDDSVLASRGATAAATDAGDGVVYFNGMLLVSYMTEGDNPDGDINNDHVVDFKDFAIVAENWLESNIWP